MTKSTKTIIVLVIIFIIIIAYGINSLRHSYDGVVRVANISGNISLCNILLPPKEGFANMSLSVAMARCYQEFAVKHPVHDVCRQILKDIPVAKDSTDDMQNEYQICVDGQAKALGDRLQ